MKTLFLLSILLVYNFCIIDSALLNNLFPKDKWDGLRSITFNMRIKSKKV